MAAGEARKQSPENAAEVIIRAATDPNPTLRYQTSTFTSRLLGIKLADLDDSHVTGFTAQWLD